MKKPLLTLAVGVLAASVSAQSTQHVCGTDHVYHQMVAANPSILYDRAALEEEIKEFLKHADLREDQPEVLIPLVFHILHLKGAENISYAQIVNQVELLNRDFATLNADTASVIPAFQDRIGRSKIRFALATKDKYGNCTNGVDRIETVQTMYGEAFSKLNQWPRNKYLNIWVARRLGDLRTESNAAAYALYPSSTDGFMQLLDGIMSRHTYVGNTGTAAGNDGRTITHEMGHSLNLSHVWGDTNQPGVACGDDGVQDTPQTFGFSGGCPTNNLANAARCDRMAFMPEHNTGIWDFAEVTTTSGSTDPFNPPAVIDTINDALRTSVSAFQAVGVSANSTAEGRFAFSGWGTGAEDGNTSYADLTGERDANKYYQVTLTPAIDQVVKVDTIRMYVRRSLDGPRTFSVRHSLNNYGTNLVIIPGDTSKIGIRGGANANIAYFKQDTDEEFFVRVVGPAKSVNALNLRFYAWNAEAPEGSFSLDNVRIVGSSDAIENFQNYMDYSSCGIMFTHGQVERMYAALFSTAGQRNELWTPENHVATGVAPGSEVYCAPEADFYAVVGNSLTAPVVPFTPMTCAGTTVRFVDNSHRAMATSWAWTFQDGEPATSSEQNPVVQFSTPGWKTVTLTVANAHGESSKTIENAVFIAGGGTNVTPPFIKGFESNNLYPMTAYNHDHNHTFWQPASNIASTGNRSARLNSGDRNPLDVINPNNYGDIDDLVTPVLNLSSLSSTGGVLSFDYHYATMASDTSQLHERLDIQYSITCGRHWLSFNQPQMSTIDLVTNGNASDPGAWRTRVITLPNATLADNVAFRFKYTSAAYSGDLYIDNIYIGAPVGVEELSDEKPVTLFPNPTEGQFTLQVLGMDHHSTTVMIQDLSGATVYSNVYAPQGSNAVRIDTQALGLANGMYLVVPAPTSLRATTKLIVGR
jgi:hypothetical protein